MVRLCCGTPAETDNSIALWDVIKLAESSQVLVGLKNVFSVSSFCLMVAEFKFEGFMEDTCRGMVAMMDVSWLSYMLTFLT